jgi:hypothetical protein
MTPFLLVFALAASTQEPPPAVEKAPSPEAAAAAIAEALEGDDVALAQGVLKNQGTIASPLVVAAIAPGLKHADPLLRVAAVMALRFNKDPSATEVLIKQRSNKKLLDEPVCAEAYMYALGQKRDKRALPILKDSLVATGSTNGKVMTAKLYALGRIRDKESCEILMDFLNSAVLKVEQYMVEIRMSMVVLTGLDQGEDRRDWLKWWNDSKSKLKLIAEEPPLPDSAAKRKWTSLWMSPEEIEAERKARREKGAKEGENP